MLFLFTILVLTFDALTGFGLYTSATTHQPMNWGAVMSMLILLFVTKAALFACLLWSRGRIASQHGDLQKTLAELLKIRIKLNNSPKVIGSRYVEFSEAETGTLYNTFIDIYTGPNVGVSNRIKVCDLAGLEVAPSVKRDFGKIND